MIKFWQYHDSCFSDSHFLFQIHSLCLLLEEAYSFVWITSITYINLNDISYIIVYIRLNTNQSNIFSLAMEPKDFWWDIFIVSSRN